MKVFIYFMTVGAVFPLWLKSSRAISSVGRAFSSVSREAGTPLWWGVPHWEPLPTTPY